MIRICTIYVYVQHICDPYWTLDKPTYMLHKCITFWLYVTYMKFLHICHMHDFLHICVGSAFMRQMQTRKIQDILPKRDFLILDQCT